MAPLLRLSSLALIPSHTFANRGHTLNVWLKALVVTRSYVSS